MRRIKLCVLFGVLALAWIASGDDRAARALSRGPFLERTAAPGEETCNGCHRTYPLDSGAGSVEILDLPERYTPATVYPIRIHVTDPVASQWGFEITAIDEDGAAAGFFQTNTDTVLALGPSQRYGRYYAHQTLRGTYPGLRGAAEWTFFWKSPAADVGPVTFYAAGNGANGDHTDFYDYIYTTNVTIDGQTRNVRVRLLTLDAGERLGAGEPATIRWDATDGDTATPAAFRVLLSTDGGENYPSVIADNLPATARSLVWQVPEALSTASARIRVVAIDTGGDEHGDASRMNLTIGPLGLDRREGAVAIPGGSIARTAAWADADGDGLADAVVARVGEPVLFAVQNGDGTFADRTATSGLASATDVRAAAWADVDGDDRPDLAAASPGAIRIYHNEGEGVLSLVGAPTSLPSSADPRGLAWSDVDADGDVDLLVATGAGLVALRNTGAGSFEDVTSIWSPPGGARTSVAAGPLVAMGGVAGIELARFIGGRLVSGATLVTDAVRSVEWADVTGDGWLDLVAATDGGLRVFASAGGEGARFEDRTSALGLGGLGATTVVAAGDYDADGRADLFVVVGSSARIWRNRGTAGFVETTARFALDAAAVSGAWVDLDASGTVDLVSVANSSIAVLTNPRSGASALRVRPTFGGASAGDGIARIDLDGDGDFATGDRLAVQVDPATGFALASAPGLATARIRMDFAGGVGLETSAEVGGATAGVERPTAGTVATLSATSKKLVANGAGLPATGARIEVAGVALARVKAPGRFVGTDGRATRLVGRDPALAALLGARPVVVRIFDPATGVLTAPVLLE